MKSRLKLAVVSSLSLLVASSVIGSPEETDESKPRPIKIIASPAILQPGTSCKIEVDERPPTAQRSVVTTLEGTVIGADDKGIRLKVHESRREIGVPIASKLPFANRMFRNVGIGRPAPGAKNPAVAIPASKIRSVTILSMSKEIAPNSPLK
ncbi:hypothetical protein [Singulisphaera sp. PoT]|uniref:hypothetical protein n=1 Tax=Singulisphaera sp. PoT TaxID=3411797 RepID=UPI003BF61171